MDESMEKPLWEDPVCWLCDYWWAFLAVLIVVIAGIIFFISQKRAYDETITRYNETTALFTDFQKQAKLYDECETRAGWLTDNIECLDSFISQLNLIIRNHPNAEPQAQEHIKEFIQISENARDDINNQINGVGAALVTAAVGCYFGEPITCVTGNATMLLLIGSRDKIIDEYTRRYSDAISNLNSYMSNLNASTEKFKSEKWYLGLLSK